MNSIKLNFNSIITINKELFEYNRLQFYRPRIKVWILVKLE